MSRERHWHREIDKDEQASKVYPSEVGGRTTKGDKAFIYDESRDGIGSSKTCLFVEFCP